MSPFFQDEFIFNEEDKPKKRKNDSGYGDPYADDEDDERDD